MKSAFIVFTAAALLMGTVIAEDDVPFRSAEERSVVDAQAAAFNQAISPLLKTPARSTVRIWAGSRRLSYGTVIGSGSQVLTKWSEVEKMEGKLRVDAAGDYRLAKVAGVYPEDDLAVLDVEGTPLEPVKWSFREPTLGAFIAAPQPDGRLAAFGVVSVLERNLRDTDMAFLGVIGDDEYRGPGVRIKDLQEKSGAFAAGLKKGDIILRVADREISGLLELRNALTGAKPGDRVSMLIQTGKSQKPVEVVLGSRPEGLQAFSGARLRAMERMGGSISQVRDSFTRAVQTDMRPKPNQIGGPVVDLTGGVLGITLARADRTRSFYMPAAAIVDLLAKKAMRPEELLAAQQQAEAEQGESPQARRVPAPGRERPRTESQMRRHLSDMQRLMDHLEREMELLEGR